ncbi:MAG: glycosyltransferase family 2 protein [Bryobacteraceae bacterium]|jgi:GT2 family glycosyltransferase
MRISVVVPVFDGASSLTACLAALERARFEPVECIVVDDGSSDGSGQIAASLGYTVLSTRGRFGPARARNLGAASATGRILVFLDADVAVHADVLRRIADRFSQDPDLDAVIGSYDDSPADPSSVSQFKNLMHSYMHHSGKARAATFWGGCGAVKCSVFRQHGGLDESYRRPSVEDIEFGFRLMHSGGKLVLDPRIQCTHLKKWTFWGLVKTDVLQRGVPWTELILRTRFLPDDLNLAWSQRISVALTAPLAVLLGAGLWQAAHGQAPITALVGAAGIPALVAALNYRFHRFLHSRRGWRFSLLAVPLLLAYYFYCGLAFALGLAAYARGVLVHHGRVTVELGSVAGTRPESSGRI